METEINYIRKPELNNPILIQGLPGVGNVGRIAVSYLIEKLKAEKFAEIYSSSFFPLVLVSPKSEIVPLRIEVYYYKGKKDLIFVVGDSQPVEYDGYYEICERILDLCTHFGVKEIITVGGFGIGIEKQKPRVLGVLTDLKDKKRLRKYGVYFEKECSVGSIFGVSGLLLAMAMRKKIRGFCLLGETIGYPILTDPKAAEEVLKILMDLLEVEVDLSDINKSIIQLEKFLKDLEEKTKQLTHHIQKPSRGCSEYIG